MTEYTDDQRARARALHHQFYRVLTGRDLSGTNLGTMSSTRVKAWLELEQFILDPISMRGSVTDSILQAWHTMAKHPFFADCYSAEDTLLGAMIAKLDATHYHVCQPWRPTTAREIHPGWMIRSHDEEGVEATWGIAHHQDPDGDWRTQSGAMLTHTAAGWTYETTAPVPKPDRRIKIVRDWANEPPGPSRHEDFVDLLARLDAFEEGEQS